MSNLISVIVIIQLVTFPLVFWLIIMFVARKALRELNAHVGANRQVDLE